MSHNRSSEALSLSPTVFYLCSTAAMSVRNFFGALCPTLCGSELVADSLFLQRRLSAYLRTYATHALKETVGGN